MKASIHSRVLQVPISETQSGSDWQAAWLLSAYPDPIWTVADTLDPSKTATLDFRLPLFDGRCLTATPRLYSTVKEYARWVRDPRFSRIDDSETHVTMVRTLMYVAHALSVEGIVSFFHLEPYDIDRLVEKLQHGTVGATSAIKRIEGFVAALGNTNSDGLRQLDRLKEYTIKAAGKSNRVLDRARIVSECNLPAGIIGRPAVSALFEKIAKDYGLDSQASTGNPKAPLLPPQPLTTQALARYLEPIEQLWAMRRHIQAESISFKPFPLGAAKVAAVKGSEAARTATPPPRLALYLLSRSADVVLGTNIASIQFSIDRSEITHAATACWILIAAFSARRHDEIDGLTSDCIAGNDTDGWSLRSFIGKTLQREEWIPVPSLVARAVDILVAISQRARSLGKSQKLFQWLTPNGQVVGIDAGQYLDEFAAKVEVPPYIADQEKPEYWHWHAHQFRRFFAILYFYRYEDASIETLSHHLRHFSIEMTRRYVTMDPEVAALWTDVEWGYMGHVARQIASGERSVSGAAGTRLKRAARRLVDTFRRRLHVVSPERVGATLANMMQRKGLVLTPKPWVTCTCPLTAEAALAAACRRGERVAPNSVGPNFANAGPTVCPSCPHGMTEGAKRPYVEAEAAYVEAAVEAEITSPTIFGTLQRSRVIELRAFLESS